MGIADDLLRAFFEQHPEAKSGGLSLPELNKLMQGFQQGVNKTPNADFDGLSSEQMHFLLHEPFSAKAILQFNKAMDQHLETVPLFKLSELLLAEIRDAGKLKLTTKGNLPVRVCELLFNQQLIKWKYMKYVSRVREEEVPYLGPLKFYLIEEGIVKKRNNTLSFTKNGEKLMEGSQTARFISLFFFFAKRFNWVNFYRLEDNGECGQLGWAYSLVLLGKYGDKARDSEFYSFKLIQAFEKEMWDHRVDPDYQGRIQSYHWAYSIRFFESFASWFGLVNIERKRNPQLPIFDQVIVSKSKLFDQLFESITRVDQK